MQKIIYKNVEDLTFSDIWKILVNVDCSDKTQDKNGFTFLSWSWAWGKLMDHFPFATYTFLDDEHLENGTVMTNVSVSIGKNRRTMHLPVMDYRNNSIQNPTTRQISDARMRCLVKCLALFGLGHYIYAGEELPDSAKDKAEAKVVAEAEASTTPNEYGLCTADGEDLGVFVGEQSLLKELRTRFSSKPNDVVEDDRKFFESNRQAIMKASVSAQGKDSEAFAKLIKIFN